MKIAVISGPNLNMLGKRDPKYYGTLTLHEIETKLKDSFQEVSFEFFQSNHEGALIDYIQTVVCDGFIINAAGYTHTSVAIRDALEIRVEPIVEVHLSNPDKREDFRKINYLRDVITTHFQGEKIESYLKAVRFLLSK